LDTISTHSLLLVLLLMLLVSAFFSAAETGMMSLNRYKLRHLVKSKHRGAMRVERLLQRPDRLLGLILIGNNLVNILASSIATLLAIRVFGDYGIAVATTVLTFAILIFSEVTPKTLAAMNPERIAYPAAIVLRILMVPLYPLVWLINAIANGLLELFGIKLRKKDESLNSEELRTVLNESNSLIPRNHQEMLMGVLELEHLAIEEIMVPRAEIYAININDDWKTIQRQLTNTPHTKVLLYRDTLDDAVGFIHVRDALRLLTREQFNKESLLRTVHEVYFIPSGTPLLTQLIKFRRNKERIGLVVDEYGDIRGLTTLDDILEEIVGDFTTSLAPSANEEIHVQEDGSYLIEGAANLRDINKELEWNFPTDGPRTLNGLILEYLEDLPQTGSQMLISQYQIEIFSVENNMVKLARVTPPSPPN
jgi:Mg2+/Co2+ transporter CorB